jgi:hypothetical protein
MMTEIDLAEMRTFHNRLRKLLNIDMSQLVNAEVISSDDTGAWLSFCDNPWRWFIRCSDEQAERIWTIMERRANPATANASAAVQEFYDAARADASSAIHGELK